MSQQSLNVAPGDLIARQEPSGSWRVIKILEVEALSDGTSIAHCLIYNDAQYKPTANSLGTLGVRVWHVPVSASSFGSGCERISKQAVSRNELAGFIEYLKLTDFPRYVAFTGQDLEDIVHRANEHYKRGCDLSDQERRAEAIAEYSQAVDLFPLFYEAIDNRAFTYMEQGDYNEALADFKLSLRVNPGGVAAFFSTGECLLRLGHAAQAEEIFEDGTTRFPDHRADFEKYLQIARSVPKGGQGSPI
jgi:tetratricopeptide (TPR) repeat protein